MLPDSDHSPQLVELKYTMSQISGLARRLVSELGMGGDSRLSTEGQDGGITNLMNDASMAMARQTSGSDDMDGVQQQRGTSGVMRPRKPGGAAHAHPVSHESVWAGDVLGELIRLGVDVSSGLRMVLESHGRGAQGTTEAAAAGGGEGGSPPLQPSQGGASPLASLSQASLPGSSTSSAIKVRAPPMFLV